MKWLTFNFAWQDLFIFFHKVFEKLNGKSDLFDDEFMVGESCQEIN